MLRKDIKELINEIEQGEDYILDEGQANIVTLKDVFNELDRELGRVSRADFVRNLAMKERFLDAPMKSLMLVDYTSEMKKLLNIKDVASAVGRIDSERIDWLDVITCFIESPQKREIMKGFLSNSSFTNELSLHCPRDYNYDIGEALSRPNPNATSVNADANYLRFMKQSSEQYQFKLSEVDVGLENEAKGAQRAVVS